MKKIKIDLIFLEILLLLTLFSLLAIYSSTMIEGSIYFKKHFLRIILGILALFIGILIPYEFWSGKRAKILYIFSLVILFLTILFSKIIKFSGTIREFSIFSLKFQPQEFCKIVLLFFVADFLAKIRERKELGKFHYEFLLIILLIFLILIQPAIGTTIILSLTVFTMLLFAGIKFSIIFFYILIIFSFLFTGINIFPHAKRRFEEFKKGNIYQQYHSKIAIGSGGLLGKGLGCGKQKFKFIPKIHTDFIFAGMAEELGFIIILFLLLGYYFILIRGITIAQNAPTDFGRFFAIGFIFMISFYIFIHIFSAFGLIPVTGQPLPFISYGGSALISNLFGMGVILNISREGRTFYEI
ncbi:MAG: FtsW/RodA/SpoVE family cell cycle protein [candidate division WOR-3 bacterium]|nr:FtsW/RodA/SpoVE family cell cycle protein [candidate division WOR-3 bacterium]